MSHGRKKKNGPPLEVGDQVLVTLVSRSVVGTIIQVVETQPNQWRYRISVVERQTEATYVRQHGEVTKIDLDTIEGVEHYLQGEA